jgi:hypothetical protein
MMKGCELTMTQQRPAVEPLTGSERLEGSDLPLSATIHDFWSWAFSDLLQNSLRGVYGEWIVAQLLGIAAPAVRNPWGVYDLETPAGTSIEVKTCGFIQAWSSEPSVKLVFSGLKSQVWEQESNTYPNPPEYHAQYYVFCLNLAEKWEDFTPLSLNQWRFFLLSRSEVEAIGTKGISLSTLRKNKEKYKEMTAVQFQEKARKRMT